MATSTFVYVDDIFIKRINILETLINECTKNTILILFKKKKIVH